MIDVIMVFSIAKMFQNNSFSKNKQLFFSCNSTKKKFKCHLKTVYADCICFW